MCNGSGCEFEKSFSGDCNIKKSDGPAPCTFESDEEYESFMETFDNDLEPADFDSGTWLH